MGELFGTDGIRAIAGEYPLDYTSVYRLGEALVSLLREKDLDPEILIGKDTRESGMWIEQALFQGIQKAKGKALSAGVIPTSAISYLTRLHEFSAGVVISASHNPYLDNGIKIFSSEGVKISEEWEKTLEEAIISMKGKILPLSTDISPRFSFRNDYVEFLKGQLSRAARPRKIKMVIDCSNGASFSIAPQVFQELGFEIIALNNCPDGKNINKNCGSLHPGDLARRVVEERADIGIAYDGDADRAIWVDEKGNILNGDHTLFVLSQFMKEKGRLKSKFVVATTMSNLALEKALDERGLKLRRTKVGDKYVLEEMIRCGSNLGGEQSGHTIFLDDCPTGDGILTSLKMLEAMIEYGISLSKMIEGYREYPQVHRNIEVKEKKAFSQLPEILELIEHVKNALGDNGRVEVRYSGTEPMARIMVEGKSKEIIENYSQTLCEAIKKHLG